MNLVQINERLKDLPMQVVQQYANGMNPEVPPYLALGELQRRELSQKQMATAQGAMQGAQPSVKDQVEQKAGLMALQQMQQQQLAQQQSQPRGPMPAPAGVPQPQDQPEAPMMAARGGLARIPVRSDMFEYAGGGIVAFAGGGDVDSARESAKAARARLMSYGLVQRKNDPEGFEAAKQEAEAAIGRLQAAEAAYAQEMGASGMDRPVQVTGMPKAPARPTPKANEVGTRRYSSTPYGTGYDLPENALPPTVENVFFDKDGIRQVRTKNTSNEDFNKARLARARTEQQPTSQGPSDPFAPRYPQSGLLAAAEVKAPPRPVTERPVAERPAAPTPAQPQAGLPAAAQNANPYEDRLNELALKQPVAPTTQDAISRVNELSPAAMKEAAMQRRNQEMRDRAAGYKEQFEKGRPSGLDDLIRVFGQAGQYKGLSGLAPAYTANQQQKRAEELAMTRQYNELMNLADTKELEGSKELFGARTKAFDTAQQLFGKDKEKVIDATASLYQTTQNRIDNELKRLSDMDIKKLELAQRERERKTNSALNPNAMVLEYAGLMAKSRDLREKGNLKEANELAARANDLMTFKSGSGAAGAERNDIKATETLLKNQQTIISDPLSSKADKEEARRKSAEYTRQLEKLGGVAGAGGDGGSGPKIGDVQQGFRFKGGNPADQSNWEKVK